MINGHGGDAWTYKAAIKADFSSNVFYGPLDQGLLEHLRDKLATVTHYPEAGAQGLQLAAAEAFGLASDNVLITNGATEAIYLTAMAFRSLRSVTLFTPSFAEYADACRLYDWEIQYKPWSDLLGDIQLETKMIVLCNPNNPTGQALPAERILALCKEHPDKLFVVDESYISFTRHTTSLLDYLRGLKNLLLLGSLTKTCRIPGLRVGFAIGHRGRITQLQAVRMPWSVNRLAIEAGLYIFQHPESFTLPLEQLLSDTAAWRQDLRLATGWNIHDTHTHYFLMETPEGIGAAAVKQRLVRYYGLLIRDASNFKGLSAAHFRVACQSREDNALLTQALRECIQNGF